MAKRAVSAQWKEAGQNGLNYFMGWGLSTMLLWLCRRWLGGTGSSEPEPSKFTYDNVNAIGSTIPVVIGRGLIKSPLVSYYGDYDYKKYFEEYGAHSKLNVWPMLLSIIIPVLIQSKKSEIIQYTGAATLNPDATAPPAQSVIPGTAVSGLGAGTFTIVGASAMGPVYSTMNGTIEISSAAKKRTLIINAFCQLILWLLMYLINKHLLKTTIQKGFKYYLGWQNIICWTGDNIGIKKIYMNVYDDNIEESVQKGVWDNSDHVAWKQDNPKGLVAHIDDEDMFGGPDEGGGFVGDIRLYFGTIEQGHDSWMVKQMTDSPQVPDDLKGLTPVYPMYFTSVVPKAYIGKQPNIPEMWFEIVNYPSKLWDNHKNRIVTAYNTDLETAHKRVNDYLSEQDPSVQTFMNPYKTDLDSKINNFKQNTQNDGTAYDNSWNDVKTSWGAFKSNFPNAISENLTRVASDLDNLLNNGVYKLSRVGDDENPAGAIYEILKNNYWGCNYPDTRIDIDSLIKLGKICELEKLGVSFVLNNTDTASAFINKILTHINGVCYDSPTTGMLTFKLIRNDYDVDSDSIVEFNTSNCESLDFTRLDWSETISAINVNYVDAKNKYDTSTVIMQDRANTFITEDYKEQDVDGSYFTTPENARTMAQTQLLAAGYPLATISAVTNRIGYDVTIGDPIRVNWEPYGIAKQAYRVTDIDYGSLTDGSIKINAVEDVFGFGKVDYDYHGVISWEDKPEEPDTVDKKMFLEMPYELTLQLNTYINAYANRPNKETRSWFVYKYLNGATRVGARTSSFSTIGKLTNEYPISYSEDSNGFEVEPTGTEAREQFNRLCDKVQEDGDTYNNKSSQNVVMIDDEIMSFNKIELTPNGSYKLTGVVRGIFDTLPERHVTGSTIYFLNTGINVNGIKPACNEGDTTVDVYEIRTASATKEQDFILSEADTVRTKRRSESPTVMSNLKMAIDKGTETQYKYMHEFLPITEFSGDFLYTFNPRNKFNNYGIIDQTDSTAQVTMNVNLFNIVTIKGYNQEFNAVEDVSYDTNTGANKTSMQMKWADFCKLVGDTSLRQHSDIDMVVRVYDKHLNLYSWSEYTKNIIYNAPILGGVFTDYTQLQTFANSVVNGNISGTNAIILPETIVSERQAYNFDDCVLLAIGTQSTKGKIKAQDGFMYDVQNTMYRICGIDDSGNAILNPVTIDDGYRIASRYNRATNNVTIGYKYTTANGFEQKDFV